jgi:predicted acyl esterase
MRMPLKPGCSPLSLIPSLEQIFFEYLCRGDEDEFWRQDCINFEAHLDRFADAPTVVRCGWYDVFALTNGAIYPRLAAGRKGPIRLILGPWVHMGCERSWAGDVDFGPDAALDGNAGPSANELRLRWFDRWLKDVLNGVDDEPPVRILVMGGGSGRKNREGRLEHGGRWRSEAEWPLRRARSTPFYFHPGGLMSTDQPGPTDPSASFRFDPDHPVPTISANVASYYEHLPVPDGILPAMATPRSRMRSIVLQGPSNQREAPGILGCRPPYPPIAARPDVLVFQTPSLARDLEVTGPIVVKLCVSSTAPDTDFTAMLLDVYPPNEDYPQGYDLNLCDGIQRARYRDGYERARFMTPGEVYPITIELGPTSNLFKAGHRIRVHVSSSNFPRFDVNPNTGGPLGSAEGMVIAHNTIHLDSSHPSHVVLPIVAE